MKKRKQIVCTTLLLFMCLFCILPVSNVMAGLDGYAITKKNFTVTLFCNAEWNIGIPKWQEGNVKQVKVSSSNKSIATIAKFTGSKSAFYVRTKKAGTARITITATVNGKKTTYKGTVKVVKFANPFKTFKINGSNYLSKINSGMIYYDNDMCFKNILLATNKKTAKEYEYTNLNSDKLRLNYSLSPEWQITSTSARYFLKKDGFDRTYGTKVKSGVVFPIKDTMERVCIEFKLKNKKNGAKLWLYILAENS